ncbi:translocation/assembly module TamB domain-containing protein [Flavobacteriaceae bacterium 3-367]
MIIVLGTVVLSLPFVQTRFARFATDSINTEFGTNINIDRLRISLITLDASMEGIYVEDYKKDTLIYIDELTTSILSMRNMARGKLEFGDIDIEKLDFKMKTYKDAPDSNLGIFVDKLDDGKPRAPGTPPFFFSSSDVTIEESRFRLIDENLEQPKTLDFKELNIEASDFQILGPEVTTEIEALSLHSKEGLKIQRLATGFKYTKQQMRFDSLHIDTPESSLNGNLVFNYNREDFANFTDKVNLTASFAESTIALDEINLLYDQFGKGKEVSFSSDVNGVLNDLNMERLFVQSDQTGIRGDFNFKNLFSREAPFELDADIKDLTTSYYQLRSLLPNILGNSLPSSFQRLGRFTIRGDALISETSIVSKVNINTAIGSSYSDLELTEIDDIDNASYKGFVSFIDFDIGNFLQDKNFGKTSLDFNVDGRGFVQENLNTEVIGEVYNLTFNNYDYKGLKVSGILKEQLFDGSLLSNDENFKFNFKGLADFGKGDSNNFNFIASVDYADLKKLNFINDSVSVFKGHVNMDITGNTMDNIVGEIKFSETNYQNKNDTYYFDDFKISSQFEADSSRTIEINSPDIITGYMKGYFKVGELGKLMQNSVGSIYTNYKPYEISEGQRLDFNFNIYNKIVDVFFPEVTFGPNTFIRGNIIADEGDFKLIFKSPSIAAFGNKMDNIDVKVDNKNPLFNTFVSVEDVSTIYYDVKNFSLINTTLKDTLFFRTEFQGGSEYDDSYNLNFYHTFNKQNKSVIGLKTSDISFKGNKWVLNREGNTKNKVILNKTLDSITIEEIVMNNNRKEQIRLRGQLADSTYKDLELQFKIVSLDKITPAIDSLKLQGEVNGTLNILQKDDVYLPSSNLAITDFSVNKARLGNLAIGIVGNRDLTDFVVNTQITDNGREKLSVIGNITNQNNNPKANLLANFNDFEMAPFSPLGEGVITNIRGYINGSARIIGDIKNPDISGQLTLNDAGLGIPYLNVDYAFAPNSRVRLFDQTFYFENIGLTDVAYDTKANIDGTISHTGFGDWRLDLDLDSNNDRFLILNTEFEEEVLYYGTGFFNGTGRIFGPTSALTINVDGSTAPGTSLKIPLSDIASVGDYSFINFIERNDIRTIEEQRVLRDYEGLELVFDLDVTPDAEVEIVVDQKTGSSLKGTGEGILLIEINTNGKFNMYGEFVAVTGEYNYRFGGVIDKTFTVRPGGTILWEGDPLAARLNMEAVYSLNANPSPLLDNAGFTGRIPTDVVVRLTEELERPNFEFNIEFPGTNSIIKSELEYRLQDPTVEERNAFFLLAQGTFVNESTGINQQAVTGNLIQTASGLLNQVLAGDNSKFDLGVSYEQGYLDPSADVQTENRIGVTVSTQISDRILLNGEFGVPVGGVSETIVAGDVEVQVLLNEDGTLRAKIFNRENEIQQFLADRQGYTQGVGLSYEVDFNNFKELMGKIFKKKPKPEVQTPEPDLKPQNIMGKDSLIQFTQKPKTLNNRP